MFCPNCGNQLNPGAAFCGKCGAAQNTDSSADPFFSIPAPAPMQPAQQDYSQPQDTNAVYEGAVSSKTCPGCGNQLSPDAVFCGKCGTPLQTGGSPAAFSGTAAPVRQPQQQYYQQQYGQPYYAQQNYTQPTYRGASAGVSPKHVGFKEAAKLFFINWKDYEGRSTRSEFWYAAAVCFLISLPFTLIGRAVGSLIPSLLVTAFLFVPSFSLLMRRVHDTGREGTTVVVMYAITLVEYLIAFIMLLTLSGLDSASSIAELFAGLAASFGVLAVMLIGYFVAAGIGIYLLVIANKASQPGPNRYGRAPYGRDTFGVNKNR